MYNSRVLDAYARVSCKTSEPFLRSLSVATVKILLVGVRKPTLFVFRAEIKKTQHLVLLHKSTSKRAHALETQHAAI